jgi:hypothetical protein
MITSVFIIQVPIEVSFLVKGNVDTNFPSIRGFFKQALPVSSIDTLPCLPCRYL